MSKKLPEISQAVYIGEGSQQLAALVVIKHDPLLCDVKKLVDIMGRAAKQIGDSIAKEFNETKEN